MGDQTDEDEFPPSVLPCTVPNILGILKETGLRCNLRVLGSQLGLTTQDLDDYDMENKKHPARKQLHVLLDICSQRGLLDWKHIVETLKKPALEQYGRNTVSRIVSEQCRRGSSASTQSLLLSPVSVTSESHPFEKSASLEGPVEEEHELTVPNVVNRIYSYPAAVDRWRKVADTLGVTMDMKYDTKDIAENIQRMVEEWFNQSRPSWETLQNALRDARPRAQSDARSSESNSDMVDTSCAKKGVLTTEDLKYVRRLIWDSRTKWKDIGIELGMQLSNLDVIKKRERDDPHNCFTEMLLEWLRCGDATLTALSSALEAKTVGFGELAEKVILYRNTTVTNEAPVASKNSSTQPKSIYSREEAALIQSTSDQEQVEISFQCPCGQCTLESYLNGDCSKQNSSSYPYLNVEHLSEDERDDLIQKLSDDTEQIRLQFADLCNDLSDSLKNRDKPVSTNELIKTIVSADKSLYGDLIKAIDIDAVFIVLYKQMSFFNYEIIKYIVKRLGDKEDDERLKLYMESFKEFCKRRIFEVTPHTFGSNQTRYERKQFALTCETELYSSLSEVKGVQRKIAKLFDIKPSLNLHLECVDEGSIIMVFSIPDFIAQEIFPLDPKILCELKAQGFTLFIPKDYNSLKPELQQASWHLPMAEDMSDPILTQVLASKNNFDQEIMELWKRFNVLLCTTKAELTIKNKSIAMLKKKCSEQQMPCSVKIQHYQYMLHIVNHKYRHFSKEMFLYLNMYCWNCFEYKLLRHVIKTNDCSQALTTRMESFERDAITLRQRSKISEFINSGEPSIRMKQSLMPPHFILVTTEHEIDSDEYKLIALDSFCEDIISNLKLQAECAFQIIMIDLKHGRTVVQWIIPYELLEVMTSFLCNEVGQAILMDHHVKDVVIDGRPVMERWALKKLLEIFDDPEESPIDENILDYVENVNTCNKVGKSFLSIAAGYGRVDIMNLLFQRGAHVDYPNEDMDGDTSLIVACDWGQLSAAERLIDMKADVNYQNKHGWTPLLSASEGGHIQLVELLIRKASVPIDFPNKEGRTALMIACWNGYLDIVDELLNTNAQSNLQDQDGLTGLILATQNGFQEIVQTLLKNGADPNITEIDTGRSAIFFAAEQGCLDIIHILIKGGAQVDLKDKDHVTALDVARLHNYPEVCEELQKHVDLTKITEGQRSSIKKLREQWRKRFLAWNKSLLRGRYQKKEHEKQKRAILLQGTVESEDIYSTGKMRKDSLKTTAKKGVKTIVKNFGNKLLFKT